MAKLLHRKFHLTNELVLILQQCIALYYKMSLSFLYQQIFVTPVLMTSVNYLVLQDTKDDKATRSSKKTGKFYVFTV